MWYCLCHIDWENAESLKYLLPCQNICLISWLSVPFSESKFSGSMLNLPTLSSRYHVIQMSSCLCTLVVTTGGKCREQPLEDGFSPEFLIHVFLCGYIYFKSLLSKTYIEDQWYVPQLNAHAVQAAILRMNTLGNWFSEHIQLLTVTGVVSSSRVFQPHKEPSLRQTLILTWQIQSMQSNTTPLTVSKGFWFQRVWAE